MNLFLDANVLLTASGAPSGASRAVIDLAHRNDWVLLTSSYVLSEVSFNLPRLGPNAAKDWAILKAQLIQVQDIWTMDRPAIFGPAKDRPVLFTAAAWAQVLLTLDREDFGAVMRGEFYGLEVMSPGTFLQRERTAGRLQQ